MQRSAVIWLTLWSFAAGAVADERTAAELLPPSTVIFAEIQRPQNLLSTVYDHRLVRRIEALDRVQAAREKKQYLDFQAGVAIVESQMAMPWRKIVGQAAGGGIVAALDAETQGVVILVRATDATISAKLVDTLTNLASLDAQNKGKPAPFQTSDYRGVKMYAVDKGQLAVVADWLVITTKDVLGRLIIDRLLDKSKESLAANSQFATAHGGMSEATTAWAYVDTAALREAGLAKKLFGGQAENPLVELILGGILSTLQHTPYVAVDVNASEGQVQLSACAPFDPSWAGELREYYFGPQGSGVAPPRLTVENTVLSVSAYRDASAMWLRAGDLFDEQTNDKLALADSNLTTLFAGKDFGEDILGAFKPAGQVIVASQRFAEGQAAPAIKLPAFGMVSEMKDPTRMQPELRRTFQSLVGFLNIVGAMNGQPQLDLDMEKTDAALFVTSSYLPDTNAKDPRNIKINYNFSPSIAFAGSRFVVASTKALAHTLATAQATDPSSGNDGRVVNTKARLQFDALREVLADNRGQLVAQNMLKEGHTKDEAERDIGDLLELVAYFDDLQLSLDTTPSELRATIDLGIKAEE
jgi:hypothetical protein